MSINYNLICYIFLLRIILKAKTFYLWTFVFLTLKFLSIFVNLDQNTNESWILYGELN